MTKYYFIDNLFTSSLLQDTPASGCCVFYNYIYMKRLWIIHANPQAMNRSSNIVIPGKLSTHMACFTTCAASTTVGPDRLTRGSMTGTDNLWEKVEAVRHVSRDTFRPAVVKASTKIRTISERFRRLV